MTTIDLGAVGAVLPPDSATLVDAAAEIETFGYSTIWLTGGPLKDLHQILDVLRATRVARVGSAIIAVDRFPLADVTALYEQAEREHPGRLVVGLGGAYGPHPVETLTTYLDDLVAVPQSARVLAALGPRMLEVARDLTAGAFPVLVTPEYTADTRAALGVETALIVMQLAVVDDDPQAARAAARGGSLPFLASLPAYQANFRRMGFTDDEIGSLADRLVDQVIACGGPIAVSDRVSAQRRAGADHVAVSLTSAAAPSVIPVEHYQRLSETLIGRPSTGA
jgi:probable F420-dependent oxidoreductase